MIGFNDGLYQPIADIQIPITSLSINRGYGAFEFFEVLNQKPFYGDRHLTRLRNSLKELRISTRFEEELEQIVNEIIKRNKIINSYISIFVLPHVENDTSNYEGSLYMFPTQRKKLSDELNFNGAKLLLRKYERDIPKAKSTSYLFGQFLRNECEQEDALDVLYYNGETIQETSRGNIFIVKSGVVLTPAESVLKGITRSVIIDILNKNNYLFQEKEITIEQLFNADEVFVTSTTKHVMPIVEIHNQQIGNGKSGEITLQLLNEFRKIRDAYTQS